MRKFLNDMFSIFFLCFIRFGSIQNTHCMIEKCGMLSVMTI